MGPTIEQETAFSFLFLRTSPILFLSFLYDPIYTLLVRLSPPTSEEGLSETRFISEQSLSDITTALILAEQEQLRIFERYSESIDNVRIEKVSEPINDFTIIRKSNIVVINEIDLFLKRIINFNLSPDNSEIYVFLQNRQTLLKSIDETVFDFVSVISERHLVSELDILVQSSSESLHANFITAVEATKSKDQLDIDILLKITADKGPLMEQIRRYHLAEVQGLNPDDKAAILHITDLYQRTVWLLNSWTKYIKPGLEA